MKRWIFWIAMSLVLLVVFAPARALYWLPLPAHVQLEQLSGSLWNGRAAVVKVDRQWFYDVQWQLQPLQLATGNAVVSLHVPARSNAVTLQGEIGYGAGGLQVSELQANGALQELLNMVNVKMPLATRGNWSVAVNAYQWDTRQGLCQALDGQGEGRDIQVLVNGNWQSLGNFPVSLSCTDHNAVGLTMNGSNSLGLNFEAALFADRFNVNGTVKPNTRTPEALTQMLQYLGQPDAQGRYRFSL